jgi:hypothetical protein
MKTATLDQRPEINKEGILNMLNLAFGVLDGAVHKK